MIPTSLLDDRRRLFGWVHLVSGLTLSLFIVVHLVSGCCYELSLVEGLLVLVILVTYWRIRGGAALETVEHTLMASALLLFSALVFFESIDDTGIFWMAGFPFLAYFVHQVRKARYWVAALAVELALAALLQAAGQVETPYSESQLLCVMGIVLFFWVFAHIYQSQLESRTRQFQHSCQALAEQQQHIRTILDHSPVGIWMLDSDRHIQYLNRAWVVWSGISEEQARRTGDYSALLPAELASRALASDQACFDSDGAYSFRETIPCADGVMRTFDMIKVRLNDERGRITGLVGFAIDVSRQVAAEAEQRQLEQQMQHAQRLESLGVMAGGIAHDFNNLLTAIKGSIELARQEPALSAGLQTSINCIDAAAQAAIDLCQQMLAYSGKGKLRTELFDIRDMIRAMRSLLEVSVGKHIALHCDFDDQPVAIEADRAQFRQILLNLVSNASEAIPADRQGRIDIGVARRQLEAGRSDRFFGSALSPGCYAVLSVSDNGSGMDAETLEHMFDPFFTTKFTGRGLGLSAILGILRAHRAGMEVESRSGSGTRIRVWFPCSDSAVEPAPAEEVLPMEQMPWSGRVLLVDDEAGVIQVASRMLEKLGLTVVTAANGRKAIEIFGSDAAIDWVMLDVTMPEMDGLECLRRLRENRPDIYVVMSSGYNADSALMPTQECQPDDFLTKPFSFSALRTAARRACESVRRPEL